MTPTQRQQLIDGMRHCPPLSCPQMADRFQIPGRHFAAFAKLVREAAEAGVVAVETAGSHGITFPVFSLAKGVV